MLMTIAWYGKSSIGGQAGAAIVKLITLAGPEDQEAVQTLEKDWFVDDLLRGDETEEEVERQVHGTTNSLGKGGFRDKQNLNQVI